MVDGRVAEAGTYKELMSRSGAFARYVSEFGGEEEQEKESDLVEETNDAEIAKEAPTGKARAGPTMMQAEERNTGAVTGEGLLTQICICTIDILIVREQSTNTT
jgi:hypothetical protein